MPKNYRNSKKYSRKRSQYRQQKLAVKTVKNIAREIAQEEDRKNQVWLIDKRVMPSGTDWESYSRAPADINKYHDVPNEDNMMYHMNLSNPGKIITASEIASTPTLPTAYGRRTIELRYRAVQAHLRFVNTDNFTRTVRCALAYVPNLNISTVAQSLTPQRWWLGDTNGKYKGIFAKEMKYRNPGDGKPEEVGDTLQGTKIRILDQKVIKLQPPTVYDVKGATVDDIIQHHIKEVSLSHYFKGEGKKERFVYNEDVSDDYNQMLTSGNYLLLIASDEPDTDNAKVKFYGVAGCKFRLSAAPINISNQK